MSWLMVKAASPPPPRSHHSASVIAANGSMIVFGGWNGTKYLNDLYILFRGTPPTLLFCWIFHAFLFRNRKELFLYNEFLFSYQLALSHVSGFLLRREVDGSRCEGNATISAGAAFQRNDRKQSGFLWRLRWRNLFRGRLCP